MKNTGVIRRIDDLGRIVIPKEIRKSLRIKDGDSLEVFVNNDSIVLKKFSLMKDFSSLFKDYIASLYFELGCNIMITDREKVISFIGDLRANYDNKFISSMVDGVISDRIVSFSNAMKKVSLVKDSFIDASYVIAPIIGSSDVFGSIIIFSTKKGIEDLYIKSAVIASNFLAKYIE